MRKLTALALTSAVTAAIAIPGLALAAGSGSDAPPKPTETTKTCLFGKVFDPATKKCVKVEKSSALDPDLLYGAVRELAYAGEYDRAQQVLSVMDQDDDRVLTYWGFTHRKMGHDALAEEYYQQALASNPDNILARSYMGQGYVAQGRIEEAITQWKEIVARGGDKTWAEASLREAIMTGMTYSY
ncbi:tetratricopeptide repeat protein [Marinibacterium sp. SX1]|uniref:tetratricopeptide repeat protein n=1 Tax=Marinibacterium sp. SX1 TaxID=3388424 RepID=UPI003D16EDF4